MTSEPGRSGTDAWLEDQCRELLGRLPALGQISLVTDGEIRFTVSGATGIGPRVPLVVEAVVNTYIDLHDVLQVARTGALIRLVLRTRLGAALIYTVPRSGHLVAFCRTGDAAETAAADRAIADLTTQARERARLDGQNPGGWFTGEETVHIHRPEYDPVVTGTGDHRVLELCQAGVNEVLQYVLYFGDEARTFAVDHFDCVELAGGEVSTAPARRRRVYRTLGEDLESDLRDLRRQVFPVLGRAASAVALDVEEGVLLVRWLPGGCRLFGVTVVQDYVNEAERMFADLGDAVAAAGRR